MNNSSIKRLDGRAVVRFEPANHHGLHQVRAYLVPPEDDAKKFVVEKEATEPIGEGWSWNWEALVTGTRIHIVRSDFVAPSTPNMWFVRMDVSRSMGESIHAVVGFTTDHFDDGEVIDEMEFVMLPVHNEQQVGAMTWSRDNGEIDQIYVSPEYRRQNIAQRLINAAAAIHHTHGWAGVIHANGRRTELGQKYALSWQNPLRIEAHTELSPPMDPQ